MLPLVQVFVSLKSIASLRSIEETVSGLLPVLVTVTVVGELLALPTARLPKETSAGLLEAEVELTPLALHSGVCQMPRPYVAAVRTCADAVGGAALNAITGAPGSPVPKAAQQVAAWLGQSAAVVVKYTPASVAR